MLKLIRVVVVSVFLSWLSSAGTLAQVGAPAEGPAAVTLPAELDRVLRDYEAAWRDGDGARMGALFTEDGFAIQSGRPIAKGRTAIAAGITQPGGALQLVAYGFATSGDVGHIVGGYRYPESRGTPGRFVLALKRVADGLAPPQAGPNDTAASEAEPRSLVRAQPRCLIAADLDNTGPR